MSTNFDANQYEKTFHPICLQNWEVPKDLGKMPRRREGVTEIIANDRGHISTGVPRSRTSPWGTFVGTWDMPARLPGNSMMNTTARCEKAVDKLQRIKTEGDIILSGKLKKSRIPLPLAIKPDVEAGKTGDMLPQYDEQSPSGIPKTDSGLRSGARNPSPTTGVLPPNTIQSPPEAGSEIHSIDKVRWPCPQDRQSVSRSRGEESARNNMVNTPIASDRQCNPQRMTPEREYVVPEPKIPEVTTSPDGVEWPLPEAMNDS